MELEQSQEQDESQLPIVAHHEAAHAVICFVLYGEQVIRSVEVSARDGAWGETTTYSRLPIPIVCRPPVGAPRRGNPAPVSAEAIVDAHGVLSYAGLAAEELLSTGLGSGSPPRGSQANVDPALPECDRDQRGMIDREALAKLASTVGASRPADHFFTEYWQEARRLLRVHWHAVETLAEALSEHGELNGDRVDTLLRSVCPG